MEKARDYIITGCRGVSSHKEKYDHGNHVNLLKHFEFALHNLSDKMKKVFIEFEIYDGCESFEDVYGVALRNCERLLCERIRITKEGGHLLHKVDILPILSSTLENCLVNHRD